jgi:UDP-N-acetyl-D-glucosamine dehydrogenase
MSNLEMFLQKISDKTVKVGVIGLGYVGLPLAVAFARNNIEVLGFEKSERRTEAVNTAQNYISDVTDADLLKVVFEAKRLSATTDFSRIKECDAAIICVPTPLDKFKKPEIHKVLSLPLL